MFSVIICRVLWSVTHYLKWVCVLIDMVFWGILSVCDCFFVPGFDFWISEP